MLVKDQGMEHDEALSAYLDFVVADLQYKFRRIRLNRNSFYYLFAVADMKAMSKLCSEKIPPGGHGYIFCSALKFGLWYCVLSKEHDVQE